MEGTITKDILKNELYIDGQPAVELLYSRYGGMLFSFILQFVPDRKEAEMLLVKIFTLLVARLDDAFESSLSVYCWLQAETRKIILEDFQLKKEDRQREKGNEEPKGPALNNELYFSLLSDASPDQIWVFRELFVYGRPLQELALQANRDEADIRALFKECLLLLREKLA